MTTDKPNTGCQAPLGAFLALLLGIGAGAQAGDPAKATADATVLVIMRSGGQTRTMTGTYLHRGEGKATVFAVLPAGQPGSLAGLGSRGSFMVAFHKGRLLAFVKATCIAQMGRGRWVLLQASSQGLPPPPRARTGAPIQTGDQVTLGCYTVASFQPDARPSPNLQRGVVESNRRSPDGMTSSATVNREVPESGAGGPVMDSKGRLVAFTDRQVSGVAASYTLSLGNVWAFICEQGLEFSFGYAREADAGWAVPCRIRVPLPDDVRREVRVGIHELTRALGRTSTPTMVWVEATEAAGVWTCLLPVTPPEQQRRRYACQTRLRIPECKPITSARHKLTINYRPTQPAIKPWLVPRQVKQ